MHIDVSSIKELVGCVIFIYNVSLAQVLVQPKQVGIIPSMATAHPISPCIIPPVSTSTLFSLFGFLSDNRVPIQNEYRNILEHKRYSR